MFGLPFLWIDPNPRLCRWAAIVPGCAPLRWGIVGAVGFKALSTVAGAACSCLAAPFHCFAAVPGTDFFLSACLAQSPPDLFCCCVFDPELNERIFPSFLFVDFFDNFYIA